MAAMVMLGLWATGLLVNHLVAPFLGLEPDQVVPWSPVADLLAAGCIALSAAVYDIAPRASRDPERLAVIATGYEVAVAFGIGGINQWKPSRWRAGFPGSAS